MEEKRTAIISASLLLLISLSISMPNSAVALEQVMLKQGVDRYSLGTHLEYLEDKSGTLTIDDVASPEYDNKFVKSTKELLNFGVTESAIWARFSLKNTDEAGEWIVVNRFPHNETMFCSQKREAWACSNTGLAEPFNNREIKHWSSAFKIYVSDETEIVYIRLKGTTTMIALSLFSMEGFIDHSQTEAIIFSFITGLVFLLFLFNLTAGIYLRQIAYIHLSLFIIIKQLFIITFAGFSLYLLWPDHEVFNKYSIFEFSILSLIPLTYYMFSITGMRRNYPKFHFILNALIPYFLVIIILNIFKPFLANTIASIIGIIILPIFIIIIIQFIREKKYIYFWCGCIIFLMGEFIPNFVVFGALSSIGIFWYVRIFSHVITSILFTFSVIDQYRSSELEKAEAQAETLRVQAKAVATLEGKVQERTKELAEALDEVETINDRLTESNANLETRNKIMEDEIALARKIQNALIPGKNPAPYISSVYRPMEEVGGDFYDFITFKDSNKIGIFLSDVSGHGVPAAFITSMIKTIFLLQAGDRLGDPAALLLYMNGLLQNQTAGNFVTAFYGIYDPDSRALLYSNAGHNQPYVIRRDRVSQLQGGKNTAIAMFPNNMLALAKKNFANHEEHLEPGNKLLLYTDGLVEARPVDGTVFFEDDRMEQIFKENHPNSCDLFLADLMKELILYRKSEYFEDDICVICMDIV